MKPKFWTLLNLCVCVMVFLSPAALASDGTEVFVVSASLNGDSSFMVSNGDGTFSDQKILQLSIDNNITGRTYGNGIGDFDGDGDLDYLMALGRNIYLFKNNGLDNQFAGPVEINSSAQSNYPADMAIADFNEDGHLDFVLSYYLSSHCGLYLGDGAFGFEYRLLENTAEKFSIGLDAADFNNDGHVDFVVAPNSSKEPFYVNLGDGHGSFATGYSIRDDGALKLYGIAAADFDGDGAVDLAASSKNILEIYTGNGDGTFEFLVSYDLAMNPSPLDNGDFNRDGNQDLVAANFGSGFAGVAVLLGDGNGGFTYSDTYLGEITMTRKAIAALPYLMNQKPVAQVTPEVLQITVGETVEFDASESFDDDGTIVSYAWDFGEGVVDPGLSLAKLNSAVAKVAVEPNTSYVYYDVGTYYVTLTVTDDQGATAIAQAEVYVAAIPAEVYFTPHWLNLNGRGKWLTATIRVPSGYDASQIDPDSVFIDPPGGPVIFALPIYKNRYLSKIKDWRYRQKRQATFLFDRQAAIKALNGATGKTILNVAGEISSNGLEMEFSGAGTIHAHKKKTISSFRKYLLKQIRPFFSP